MHGPAMKSQESGLAIAAITTPPDAGGVRASSVGDFRIIDSLVLAVFSVAYEAAVILLRIRSRLSANPPE
jgi:hypothetical protein